MLIQKSIEASRFRKSTTGTVDAVPFAYRGKYMVRIEDVVRRAMVAAWIARKHAFSAHRQSTAQRIKDARITTHGVGTVVIRATPEGGRRIGE